MLHGWRFRSTTRRLAARGRPKSLLFICHGNICRSPYAAASARRHLPPESHVESAGFIGPGRPAPPAAVAAAAEQKIDLTPHRSQLVTAELLQAADLVVVMDAAQRDRLALGRPAIASRLVVLGDLDPAPITRRGIPDPVDQPVDVFRSCYARIERCTTVLCGLWDAARAEPAGGEGRELRDGRARHPE